jgi:arylsulfatase
VGSKNSEVPGGRDYMATFAAPAGAKLPENDLEGKRCIFDSYDMSPLLFGTGKSQRTTWFYFTEKKISA